MRHLDEYSSKRISYRRMTVCDIPAVVRMRVQQLKDEGAQADFELKPYLTEFYERNLETGLYISWLAVCGEEIVAASGMSFTEKPPYYKKSNWKDRYSIQYVYSGKAQKKRDCTGSIKESNR
ncbi:hypothetical protein [Anaerostipes caccae]|uniref:hypothetical protein n=1 Tax=Anaerostipes caccae TaxID=105841 RepID=UPI002ED66BCB